MTSSSRIEPLNTSIRGIERWLEVSFRPLDREWLLLVQLLVAGQNSKGIVQVTAELNLVNADNNLTTSLTPDKTSNSTLTGYRRAPSRQHRICLLFKESRNISRSETLGLEPGDCFARECQRQYICLG